MSRRPRPPYRSGLEWILGVAFEDTLTRPARLAQGFTHVRCCGSPRASSPHGLTAPALASHDGRDCVQLPPARGCYHLAPRRTFTSNPVPMSGTPSCISASSLGSVVRRIGGSGAALRVLALLEPIAVAVHFEDMDVMGESVEQGAGKALGGEHAGPLVEGKVAGIDG